MRLAGLAAAAVAAVIVANGAGAARPTARTWVDPQRPFFGDTFVYAVEVVVDEAHASSVRIVASPAPFTRLSAPVTTRSTVDGRVRIRVTSALACFSAGCLPRAGVRSVALPRAVVTGAVTLRPTPPIVRVRGRVTPAAVRADAAVFRHPMELEEPTTRLSTDVLVALSGAVAVLAVLLPASVVVARRRRSTVRGSTDPVSRAVRLLRESARRPPPDRRRAASLAARVVGETSLAEDAARVAWSRAVPDEVVPDDLADRIERTRRAGS